MVLLARADRAWRDGLHLVQPDTLQRWHRDLFTLLWRRKSRTTNGPTRLRADLIGLIRTMARANALWGAERIRGELLKLRIRASKRTIQKYLRTGCPRGDRGQPLFAFVMIRHGSREIVHVNPTDAWVAQHLREATPYD